MTPQTVQASELSPTFSACSYAGSSRISELSRAQVSCFCEYPHHGFDPFAHNIAPPSLGLVSGSSVHCLADVEFLPVCCERHDYQHPQAAGCSL